MRMVGSCHEEMRGRGKKMKGETQDMWDAGQVGCRAGGMQGRCNMGF